MCIVILKSTLPSHQRNGSNMGLTTYACSGHCLLYPAETQNMTVSCNHEAWGVACVSWQNALQKMTLTRSIPSLAHRQNLLLSLKTTECHSTLKLTLSRHQSSHAWRSHGVSGSLAKGTCDPSPAASRQFPMVLDDTAGATCAQISSLDAVWAATADCTMRRSWCASILYGRPEPGLQVWECSTNHCWKQQHTIDTLWQYVQQSVDMSIQLPASLKMWSCSNGWSCSAGVRTRQRCMVVP